MRLNKKKSTTKGFDWFWNLIGEWTKMQVRVYRILSTDKAPVEITP